MMQHSQSLFNRPAIVEWPACVKPVNSP